jgi:DNA-binding transcriptional regulator YiaG
MSGRIHCLPIRQKMGLTRERFAELFDVPVESLKSWEHGSKVNRATALYLHLISLDPERIAAMLRENPLPTEPK